MFRYELVVMGFLFDKSMNGYQINKAIKAQGMAFWVKIDNPMVYLTIAKLEKKGMIHKSKVEKEGLMPERRIYRLTSKGKERLANLVEGALMEKNLTYDLKPENASEAPVGTSQVADAVIMKLEEPCHKS